MSLAVIQFRVIFKGSNSLIHSRIRNCCKRRSSLSELYHMRWIHSPGDDSDKNVYNDSKNKSGWLSQKSRNQIDAIWSQSKSIPNLITLTRIASTPIICYLIVEEKYAYAMYGCIIAGFTDWLDGFIARKYDMKTNLGTYLDPLGVSSIRIPSIISILFYDS